MTVDNEERRPWAGAASRGRGGFTAKVTVPRATPSRKRVLRAVATLHTATPAEVAARIEADPATTRKTLLDLYRDGLVERVVTADGALYAVVGGGR